MTKTETKPGLFHRFLASQALLSVVAVLIAMVIGAILIVLVNDDVHEASRYLFARPGDTFSAIYYAVSDAYVSLFRGAIYDPQAKTFARAIRPITETFVFASPLIVAGLGLAVGFRAGLFNIGAQGQMMMGAILGGFIGFTWQLPMGLHLFVAAAGCAIGGALWASIAGVLKAKTGANEVIVTIMLNAIATQFLAWTLTLQSFMVPGSAYPQSRLVMKSAQWPVLLPGQFRFHAGFIVALLAVLFTWWYLERSTMGFELRATGMNPNAARTAGININLVTIQTMALSGALAGLAASMQILGTEDKITQGIAGSFGFDAITVALLGRNKPVGTMLAGLLFGGLKAGGFLMQTSAKTPIDIVLVLQSVIVLLIAAPALVRIVAPFLKAQKDQ